MSNTEILEVDEFTDAWESPSKYEVTEDDWKEFVKLWNEEGHGIG